VDRLLTKEPYDFWEKVKDTGRFIQFSNKIMRFLGDGMMVGVGVWEEKRIF
jgi:hypothetical protein